VGKSHSKVDEKENTYFNWETKTGSAFGRQAEGSVGAYEKGRTLSRRGLDERVINCFLRKRAGESNAGGRGYLTGKTPERNSSNQGS